MDTFSISFLMKLAEKHAGINPSAWICLHDAKRIMEFDNLKRFVPNRCMASLGYSIGIFHEDYKMAKSFIERKMMN